uniref:Uncharacterized protein n=1 Tax=Setaria italica TaxID=4555 RepID=K3ZYE8_SETIT
MDHVKFSDSMWLWMIDPIWISTFAAWQRILKCKQTAFKTVMLFAARLVGYLFGVCHSWGKVWSKSKRLLASFFASSHFRWWYASCNADSSQNYGWL